MPDAMMPEDRLVLVITTERMAAADLAALISALDGSFNAFARRRAGRGNRPKLSVAAVEHGSIHLVLEAIEGIGKVVEAGKYLSPWATHLSDMVGWYLFSIPPKIPPADKKLVTAISNTVVHDGATNISLVNHGTVIFNVGTTEARGIKEALEVPRRNQDLQRVAPSALPPLLDRVQTEQLQSGDLLGTAFRAADSWFARLEGGHGVLVPIHAHGTVGDGLVDGRLYRFSGAPQTGPRGETIGISLTGAHPLS